MLLFLATAVATQVELEATTAYRDELSTTATDDVFFQTVSNALPSGARVRLGSDDGRSAVEMFGAADKLTLFDDEVRAPRWGGLRVMGGFRGRTPLTSTWTLFRAGIVNWDVTQLGSSQPIPLTFGSVGIEIRRIAPGRFQSFEADLLLNDRVVAGELRTRVGFGIRDTGLYPTLGGSTSRFVGFAPSAVSQVAYGIEVSLLFRPSEIPKDRE